MPFLPWSDKMRVGVAVFDAEHRQLLSLMNELYESILNKSAPFTLGGILDAIKTRFESHLEHEEEVFLESGYPYAQQHIEQHAEIREKINGLREDAHRGNAMEIALEAAKVLHTYLVEHVDRYDRDYAEYLNSKGIY